MRPKGIDFIHLLIFNLFRVQKCEQSKTTSLAESLLQQAWLFIAMGRASALELQDCRTEIHPIGEHPFFYNLLIAAHFI